MATLSPSAPERSGFADRHEAGHLLAQALLDSEALDGAPAPLAVVGLARGGVAVAAEVAEAFGAPLDALAVRKVGHPWQPEYGIGAVAPGGIEHVRAHDGLTDAEVAGAVRRAVELVTALDDRLHEAVAPLSVEGGSCVLVDDGLATGGTMLAAVRWARAQGAERVVVAVPVGAAATVQQLQRDEDVDTVVCLVAAHAFEGVGAWYVDFEQVSDQVVVDLLMASRRASALPETSEIPVGDVLLQADLIVPPHASGCVVFAHGSGSSRRSPRSAALARSLNDAGIATLLFDLLTPEEARDRRNVFDVELLSRRLVAATRWLSSRPEVRGLPVGYFGASTGAAAALVAAVDLRDDIAAVVSRGGRPDLAWTCLPEVRTPTLLVVGGADSVVLDVNGDAALRLGGVHELVVIPGATHLFGEPGALEQVAVLATAWFTAHFTGSDTSTERREAA